MATTTTYINQATLSTGATFVTVSGYTAPAGRAKAIAQVGNEQMLIVDTTLSPTLQVVRGYGGSVAQPHVQYENFTYGTPTDMVQAHQIHNQYPTEVLPTVYQQSQEVTITGATGTTAAIINVPWPAFLTATGTSGAGLNLPVPLLGAAYTIKNNTTGVCKIYCVGGTINGTTGTTAVSLTATGNLMAFAYCSTAGAWQLGGNT